MPGIVEGLKNILAVEESTRAEIDMIVESTGGGSDRISDAFLDDPETELMGDDAEIDRLIAQIPEYDVQEQKMEEKISAALESIH